MNTTATTMTSATSVTIVDAYLQSLSLKEQKAYHIAHTHLGTSFDMEKSVGYVAFVKRKEEEEGIIALPPKI